MPAYRSSAEGEVRKAVVDRLRTIRPGARIIHEISNGRSNRIDVLAVSAEEIVAVEIKSEKDTLDLLAAQINGMRRVAHRVIAAIHESLLEEVETNEWGARSERDGRFFRRVQPFAWGEAELWVYPEMPKDKWSVPFHKHFSVLPQPALEMIWKDELIALCGLLRLSATSRSRCEDMRRDLAWHCSGRELTRGICAMLRRRNCPEADPPIFDEKVVA